MYKGIIIITLGILIGGAVIIGLIFWYLKSLWDGMKNPYKVEK